MAGLFKEIEKTTSKLLDINKKYDNVIDEHLKACSKLCSKWEEAIDILKTISEPAFKGQTYKNKK